MSSIEITKKQQVRSTIFSAVFVITRNVNLLRGGKIETKLTIQTKAPRQFANIDEAKKEAIAEARAFFANNPVQLTPRQQKFQELLNCFRDVDPTATEIVDAAWEEKRQIDAFCADVERRQAMGLLQCAE